MNATTTTRAPSPGADPDLPDEVDFSLGKPGAWLPQEPAQRAEALEARVRALQAFGARLRDAAEQVAQHTERRDDTYIVPERDMLALLSVLGRGPDGTAA